MKSADTDLIDKLNSLPEEERLALLEFLGASSETQEGLARDMLEASAWLHQNTKKPIKN